jgi:hypothetical protein
MKKIIAILALLTAGLIAAQAEPQDAASRERTRILVDTNATTTVTLYTPTGAGQILSGKVATSNAIWVATAANTNSWVKIAQTAP